MLLFLSLIAALQVLLTHENRHNKLENDSARYDNSHLLRIRTVGQSPEQCGKVNETQLLNHETILKKGEYSWLGTLLEEDLRPLGIAVLITRRHVIFPAHCVTEKINSIAFHNKLGAVFYNKLEEVAVHPDYKQFKDNDIAIGKLKAAVAIGQPICMPPAKEQHYFGQRLEVGGGGDSIFNYLSKAQAHIATHDHCTKMFKYNGPFSSNQICGYLTDNFTSGSALMGISLSEGQFPTMRFYLIGILVFGHFENDIRKSPGVFLKIAPYRDWIARNTIE